MDGIFILDGGRNRRPRSKAEVKRLVASYPDAVLIEGTSMHGAPYSGPVAEAPDGKYHFAGPDPYTTRNFYGTITKTGDEIKVT